MSTKITHKLSICGFHMGKQKNVRFLEMKLRPSNKADFDHF